MTAAPSIGSLAQIPCIGARPTVENGVTVLRGCPHGAQIGTSGNPGEGTSNPNAPLPSGVIDQSTGFNSLHTGTENAGGIIANPPPGLGR